MTTRSQNRKAVAGLVSGEFEASVAENVQSENLIAGPIKTVRVKPENLDEIKTSLKKEIVSDLAKMFPVHYLHFHLTDAPEKRLCLWSNRVPCTFEILGYLPERVHRTVMNCSDS